MMYIIIRNTELYIITTLTSVVINLREKICYHMVSNFLSENCFRFLVFSNSKLIISHVFVCEITSVYEKRKNKKIMMLSLKHICLFLLYKTKIGISIVPEILNMTDEYYRVIHKILLGNVITELYKKAGFSYYHVNNEKILFASSFEKYTKYLEGSCTLFSSLLYSHGYYYY